VVPKQLVIGEDIIDADQGGLGVQRMGDVLGFGR
jgi:hypothetical protein